MVKINFSCGQSKADTQTDETSNQDQILKVGEQAQFCGQPSNDQGLEEKAQKTNQKKVKNSLSLSNRFVRLFIYLKQIYNFTKEPLLFHY